MRKLLVLLLLTFSAYGSSREILVGSTVAAAAASHRFNPSAASDGESFFTVWNDDRSDMDAVIGTRVTRDGRVLDPLGIRIDTVAGTVISPQVVWDGAAYLVVWSASRPDDSAYLYAARVSREGAMITPPRQIAAQASVDGRYVASNGTISVVAYLTGSREIGITVLDREGNPLHHEVIASSGENLREPVIAASPERFLVAWTSNVSFSTETEEIHAVMLTSAGHRSGSPVKAGRGTSPAIGTDGTRFTIVSRFNDDWREYTLLSRTFDASLAPIGPEQALLTQRQIEYATVLWVGDHYEVVTAARRTTGGNDLVILELDRDGVRQTTRGALLGEGEILFMRLAAATNGTDVLVTRAADGPPHVGTQVYAHLYPANATPGNPALLSWSGNGHRHPGVAISQSGHFVAWTEREGVYATRVDRNGNSLEGRGVRLSTTPPGYYEYFGRPHVVFDGTNYVVAWAEWEAIGVRWIAPLTGATVADVRIAVAGRPAIALATSDEATYLVHSDEHVRVTRIPHATYTPDPVPLVVSQEGMSPGYPTASWNGSELLVAWTEEYSLPNVSPPLWLSIAVYAARVTENLSLLDPSPLTIGAVIGNDEIGYATYGPPSVASNGAHWLVVSNFEAGNVVARRVTRGGTVEGNAPVEIGEGQGPVVVWDGTRYTVAWKEGQPYRDFLRPVVLHAVPQSGDLIATNRTVVTASAASSNHTLASAGNGETTVAYTKISFLPEHAGVERTFIREMDLLTGRGRVVRR